MICRNLLRLVGFPACYYIKPPLPTIQIAVASSNSPCAPKSTDISKRFSYVYICRMPLLTRTPLIRWFKKKVAHSTIHRYHFDCKQVFLCVIFAVFLILLQNLLSLCRKPSRNCFRSTLNVLVVA